MMAQEDMGIILADDLTGSMDTGVQLLKGGCSVSVHLNASTIGSRVPAPGFIVLDTHSRHMEGREAHCKLSGIISQLGDLRHHIIYKKIDSTFRGPVGWELKALAESTGAALLIAPSLPANGRVVECGRLLVNGVPLGETPYGKEIYPPGSLLPLHEMVQHQAGIACSLIGLKTVEGGMSAIERMMEEFISAGTKLMVADAATDVHLSEIAGAVRSLKGRIIPCGSAGLMERMVGTGGRPISSEGEGEGPVAGPILTVAGTTNPVTRAQAKRAIEEGIYSPVLLKIADMISDDEAMRNEVATASRRTADQLLSGSDVILTNFEEEPESDLPQSYIRERILTAFGMVVREALRHSSPGALILTGGDIARETCESLSVDSIKITGEPLPYLASGAADARHKKGLRLVTKAGGFGAEDVFIRLHHILHAGSRDEREK